MPRKRAQVPNYRYHVSGQGYSWIDGRNVYFGPHDDPASLAKYHATVQLYIENGRRLPREVDTHQIDAPITISLVCAEYKEHIETRYQSQPKEFDRHAKLCKELDENYGALAVADFGPRKLAELRDLYVADGCSRPYVNRLTSGIKSIFKHAVARELCDATVLVRLDALEPLRRNQTKAPEPAPVTSVEIAAVEAVAAELTPTLRAMVLIQLLSGMRPNEVCRLRPCEIDRSDPECWMYRPKDHKTAYRQKPRAIPLVGDAQTMLAPFLLRDADSHCFKPAESEQWRREQRAAARVTPSNQGNRAGYGKQTRHGGKGRKFAEFYSTTSYRQAIHRAADRVGIRRWNPGQLRHRAATEVRNLLSLDHASALLGHSSPAITLVYAEQSEQKAVEAAKVFAESRRKSG